MQNTHDTALPRVARKGRYYLLLLLLTISLCLPGITAMAQCNAWKLTGGDYLSNGVSGVNQNALAIDLTDGTPYAVFLNNVGDQSVIAKKFVSGAWQNVGTGAISDGAAVQPRIAIDNEGTPFICYADYTAAANMNVKKFNGTSWESIGATNFAEQNIYDFAAATSLVLDAAGTPYVLYNDYADGYTVKKFDGSAWVTVGTPFGFSYRATLATDGINMYVAIIESAGALVVEKYDGTAWVQVGSETFAANSLAQGALNISAAGVMRLAYADQDNSGKATVKRFDGTSWQTEGIAGFTIGVAADITMATNAVDTPYVVFGHTDFFEYGLFSKPVVMKYDGANWWTVGKAGFSADAMSYPAIAVANSGMIYTSFSNTNYLTNEQHMAVADFETMAPITTSASGCYVTLKDASLAGVWSSSNTAAAVVGIHGEITAIAPGTSTITYTIDACSSTYVQTVNIMPGGGGITGPDTVCTGVDNAIVLTDTMAGDYTDYGWSSSNEAVAVVGAWTLTQDNVTGLSAGTATIMHVKGACLSAHQVTVKIPDPGTITGPDSVFIGSSIALANTVPGGIWSTDYIDYYVSVDATTGLVTGQIENEAVNIYYTAIYSCGTATTSKVIKVVNAAPPPIDGNAVVCVGATNTLSHVWGGGTWSSGNTAVVTIGSTNGIVTAIAAGNAVITYTLPGGGTVVAEATVAPLPMAGLITGTATVCAGATTSLTDAVAGGTWSSSNTGVATVGSTGIVTGVTAGNATISYSQTNSCGTASVTRIVTVNTLPNAGTITGASTVVTGATIAMANSVTGGAWSVNNSNATIDVSGLLTGSVSGAVTVSYSVTSGCGTSVATHAVTVTSSLPAISGTLIICTGSTTALSNVVSGGTWASSNTAVATVGATGVVTGLTAGTSGITYTVAGNSVSAIVTVTATPPSIAGGTGVCLNATITLNNGLAGGTWSSSNSSIASINTLTGDVSGISLGNAVITYTVGAGCYRTMGITVKPLPAAISGTTTICVGAAAVLTDATGVGVSWQSSNPAVATIGSGSGTVSGIAAGTTVVTYTINTGCSITAVVTVNPLPAAITGGSLFCAGMAATLASADAGGMWSSSNNAVASVSPATGALSPNAAGTAYITYTLGTGCKKVAGITVNPMPAVITGPSAVCTGASANFSSATPGGVWNSSNSAIATAGTSGSVTGVSTGAFTLSYTAATGCMRTASVNVVTGLSAITGVNVTCVGSTVTLANATSGGAWSSSTATAAPVSSAGVVTGVQAGTSRITYSAGGCATSTVVTVNAAPPSITGASSVCVGITTTLANAMPGGTWSSSTALAAINSTTGALTGITAGATVITYEVSAGCRKTIGFTVKSNPVAISGNTALCTGGSSVVTDATATGVLWTSSNPSVATINPISGLVTGISAGNATITYLANSGCYATKEVTVDAAPSVAAITGPSSVTIGNSIMLADATPGGVWSSTSTNITINASGVATAVSGVYASIRYTVTNGVCQVSATKAITIISSKEGSVTPEAYAQAAISVYPNPSTGAFNVQSPVAGNFMMYTLEGRELGNNALSAGNNTLAMPAGAAAGIYMCRFSGADGSTSMVRLVYEP